jgi:hypothetical protein
MIIPEISYRGSTIALMETSSWARLWRFYHDTTGAVHYGVTVKSSPMAVQLFGQRRLWVFNNLLDARKKFHQVIGQYV